MPGQDRRRSGVVHYAAVFFLVLFGALGYGFYHYVVLPEQASRPQQQSEASAAPSYRLSHGAVTSTAGTAMVDNDYNRDGTVAVGTKPLSALSERKTEVIEVPAKEEGKIVIKFSPGRNAASASGR